MMRKITHFGVLILAINMTASVSHADNIPDSAIIPTEAMAELRGMIGDWSVQTEMMRPDGQWETQGTDTVSITTRLNNLLIAETHVECPPISAALACRSRPVSRHRRAG